MSSKALTFKKVPRVSNLPINPKKINFESNNLDRFYHENSTTENRIKNLIVTTTEYGHVGLGSKGSSGSILKTVVTEAGEEGQKEKEANLEEPSVEVIQGHGTLPNFPKPTCTSSTCQSLYHEVSRLTHLCSDYNQQIKILNKKTEKDVLLYKIQLQESYQKSNQKFKDTQQKIYHEKLNLNIQNNEREGELLKREKFELELKLKQAVQELSKI